MSKKSKKKVNVQPMELPSRGDSAQSFELTNSAGDPNKQGGNSQTITEVVTTETESN